jgi:hypothetical protein
MRFVGYSFLKYRFSEIKFHKAPLSALTNAGMSISICAIIFLNIYRSELLLSVGELPTFDLIEYYAIFFFDSSVSIDSLSMQLIQIVG